jgi:hypothetical protein
LNAPNPEIGFVFDSSEIVNEETDLQRSQNFLWEVETLASSQTIWQENFISGGVLRYEKT